MKYKIILIHITLYAIIFSETNSNLSSYEYFLHGEYEFLNKNYSKAEINYLKALLEFPQSVTILQSLVEIKIIQGKYNDAISLLNEILIIDPSNRKSSLDLFELLIEKEDHIKLESHLDSLLFYYSNDEEILFYISNYQLIYQKWYDLLLTYHKIYLLNNKYNYLLSDIYEIGISTDNIQLTYEIFTKLKDNNENKKILEYLALIAEYNNNNNESIFLLKEIINKYGRTEEVTIKLAKLNLKIKNFNEVTQILAPLYIKGNRSLEVLNMLLVSYSILKDNKNEIQISNSIIDEYPNLPIGYEALAYSYLSKKKYHSAIEILIKAINKFPNEISLSFNLAKILSEIEEYSKAEKYYRYTLSINPNYRSAKHAMAMMYEEMNNFLRSDSLFQDIIKQNKDDAIGQNDYAYIIAEREIVNEEDLFYALNLAKNALNIEPENVAFLDTVGWIYYKLGNYNKAFEYIHKSLTIDEENLVILEHLGDVYIKLNKSSEALKIYKRILKRDKKNKLIMEKINTINE